MKRLLFIFCCVAMATCSQISHAGFNVGVYWAGGYWGEPINSEPINGINYISLDNLIPNANFLDIYPTRDLSELPFKSIRQRFSVISESRTIDDFKKFCRAGFGIELGNCFLTPSGNEDGTLDDTMFVLPLCTPEEAINDKLPDGISLKATVKGYSIVDLSENDPDSLTWFCAHPLCNLDDAFSGCSYTTKGTYTWSRADDDYGTISWDKTQTRGTMQVNVTQPCLQGSETRYFKRTKTSYETYGKSHTIDNWDICLHGDEGESKVIDSNYSCSWLPNTFCGDFALYPTFSCTYDSSSGNVCLEDMDWGVSGAHSGVCPPPGPELSYPYAVFDSHDFFTTPMAGTVELPANLFTFINTPSFEAFHNLQDLHSPGEEPLSAEDLSDMLVLDNALFSYVPKYEGRIQRLPIPLNIWLSFDYEYHLPPSEPSLPGQLALDGPSFQALPVIPFWYEDRRGEPQYGFAPANRVERNIVYPIGATVEESNWMTNGATSSESSAFPVLPFASVVVPIDQHQLKTVPVKVKFTIDHGGFCTSDCSQANMVKEVEVEAFDGSDTNEHNWTKYAKRSDDSNSYLYLTSWTPNTIYYVVGPRIMSGGYEGVAHVVAEVVECDDAPGMVGKRATFAVKMTSKHIQITADKASIKPDGQTTINFTVTLRDVVNGPIAGWHIGLVLNQGKVSVPSFLTDANGQIHGRLTLPPESFTGDRYITLKAVAFFDDMGISDETQFEVGERFQLAISRQDGDRNMILLPGSEEKFHIALTDQDGKVFDFSCPIRVSVSGPADFNGEDSIELSDNEDFYLNISDNAEYGDKITLDAYVVGSDAPAACYTDSGQPLSATLDLGVGDIQITVLSPNDNQKIGKNAIELSAFVQSKDSGGQLPEGLSVSIAVNYRNGNRNWMPADSSETFTDLALVQESDSQDSEDNEFKSNVLYIKSQDGGPVYIPIKNYINDITITVKDSSGTERAKYNLKVLSDFFLSRSMAIRYITAIYKDITKYDYMDLVQEAGSIKTRLFNMKDNFINSSYEDSEKWTDLTVQAKYALALFNSTMRLLEVSNEAGETTIIDAIVKEASELFTISDIFDAVGSFETIGKGKLSKNSLSFLEKFKSLNPDDVPSKLTDNLLNNTIEKMLDQKFESLAINHGKIKEYIKLGTEFNVDNYKKFLKDLPSQNIKDVKTLDKILTGIEVYRKKEYSFGKIGQKVILNDLKNKNNSIVNFYDKIMSTNPVVQHLVNENFRNAILDSLKRTLKNIRTYLDSPPYFTVYTPLVKNNAKLAYSSIRDSSEEIFSTYKAFHFTLKSIINSVKDAGGWTSLLLVGTPGKAVGSAETLVALKAKYVSTILTVIKLMHDSQHIINHLLPKGIDSVFGNKIFFNPNDPPGEIDYQLITAYNELKDILENALSDDQVSSNEYNDILDNAYNIYALIASYADSEEVLAKKAEYLSTNPTGNDRYLGDFANIYLSSYLEASCWRDAFYNDMDNFVAFADLTALKQMAYEIDQVIDSQNNLELATAQFLELLESAYFDDLLMISNIGTKTFVVNEPGALDITIKNIGEKNSKDTYSCKLILTNFKGEITESLDQSVPVIAPMEEATIEFNIQLSEIGQYKAYFVILENDNNIILVNNFELYGLDQPITEQIGNGQTTISIYDDLDLIADANGTYTINVHKKILSSCNDPDPHLLPIKYLLIQILDDEENVIGQDSNLSLTLRYKLDNEDPSEITFGYYDVVTNEWTFLPGSFDQGSNSITVQLPFASGYYGIMHKFNELKYFSAALAPDKNCVYFIWDPQPWENAIGLDLSISTDNGQSWELVDQNIEDIQYSYCASEGTDLEDALFKIQILLEDGSRTEGLIIARHPLEAPPNQPPQITSLTVDPTSGTVPLTVAVTCQATDPDGNIASYEFNPGDGSAPLTSNDGTFSYTYNTSGSYQATCTAYDDNGASVTSDPVTITVEEAGPTWNDITEGIGYSRSRTLFDRLHRAFFVLLDVTNDSGEDLHGPVRMVLESSSLDLKEGCPGLSPDGTTDDGKPYFIIVPEGETWAAGQTLEDLRLNFVVQRVILDFDLRFEALSRE